MIVSITWMEYAALVLITIGLYYIIIALAYYKNEIARLVFKKEREESNSLSRRNKELAEQRTESTFLENEDNEESISNFLEIDTPQIKVPVTTNAPLPNALPEFAASHLQSTSSKQETGHMFQQVEELTADLEKAISQAVERNYTKEELVLSLKLILRQNNIIKTSPFLPALYNLINSELEKHGNLELSIKEQMMLWNE